MYNNETFINCLIEEFDKKELTDDLDNTKSFHSYIGWFVSYFEKRIAKILKNSLGIEHETIVKETAGIVWRFLYSMAVRTLILELYEWKENENEIVPEASSNERYLTFCRKFRTDEFFISFCRKYDVLTTKIRLLVENTLSLIQEAVIALLNDKDEISEKFHISFSMNELEKIELTDGDSHNNGKRALIVQIKNQKIIYKPHVLSTDLFLEALYVEFNKKLSQKLKAPRTICKKDYGWQEFIVKKQCESEVQYRNYYYRYGELLCIAYCLNMTDLHMENMISAGEYPVVIDTETVIANDSYNFDKNKVSVMNFNTTEKVFNRTISKSVIHTLLLPTNLLGGIFDIDLSPLSINDAQKSEKMIQYKIVEEFTDKIHVEAEYYEQEASEEDTSRHHVCAYLPEILDGFTECYKSIVEKKDYFKKFVKNQMLQNNLVVRQVLRPTYVYGKFMDASAHPDYLTDSSRQRYLISKLKAKQFREDEKLSEQADMEIKSILNGDIPYFYEKVDSKDIQPIYGRIEEFYSKTILDLVDERIMLLSQDDLVTQQRMIRLAMSPLYDSNWNQSSRNETKEMKEYIPYFTGTDQEITKAVGNYLCHEAVWSESKEFCIWVSHALLNPKLKISPVSYYLYDGGGTVLLLHYLAHENSQDAYREMADDIMRGFAYPKEMMALSAYNGIGSLLYINYTLYKLWDSEIYYLQYKKVLEEIRNIPLTDNMQIDYINGLSGMAVLLENLYEEEQEEDVLQLAKKFTDYCIEHLDSIKLAGLAHGYSGIALAAGCYHICREQKYYQEAVKVILKENEYYDIERNNWKDLREGISDSDPVYWCHGAVGICFARMKAYQFLKNDLCKSDMEKCLKKVTQSILSLNDHSLCHGMFGTIDCLISATKEIGVMELELKGILEEKYALVMEDIRQNNVVCGISNAYDMFSFMLGIPGMAYTIMRKQNKNIPSVLLLEL